MKPNRIFLGYMIIEGLVLSALLVLASLEALTVLSAVLGKPLLLGVDRWVQCMAVVGLGVLPWPGLIGVAGAVLRPRKLDALSVERRSVGSIVATLTALDDEDAVGDVVSDFGSHPRVDRVIVADNGSRDRTAAVAVAASAHVVVEPLRGFGHACRRALREGLDTGCAVIVLCEADRTFRAADLDQLMSYLQYADLVVGSRTHSVLLNSDSQLNSFFILGNLFVAKILQLRYWDWVRGGPVRLTDVGCTFMAVRADALRKILPFLDAGGSHFIPLMLMAALERGLRVIQVPVTFWRRVGVSKGGSASWRKGFALGCTMLWHILTYRLPRSPDITPTAAS